MITSPLTGKQARHLETINVADVITAYKEFGIPVERFFHDIKELMIYECVDTGYRFYHPSHLTGDQDFYELLIQERDNYYPKSRWEHQKAVKIISTKDLVLEIGSGSGHFLANLSELGVEARGLEFNEHQVRKGRERGLIVDNESIEVHSEHNQGKYDVVCSFQVLEHVSDVSSFIDASLKALRVGGKLILAVPNSNPYLFRYDRLHALNLPPHHIGLWNRRSIESLSTVFSIKLVHLSIEPLFDAKYYWKLKKQYWAKQHRIMHFTVGKMPNRFQKQVINAYRKFGVGRNIFSVFQKCDD